MRRPTTPPPADPVRIARIAAWQAVAVALIAGLAGVAGTAGLKYWDHSKALDQARQDAAAAQQALEALREDAETLQRRAQPSTILLTAAAGIPQERCFDRLQASIEVHLPNASGTSFEGRAQLGEGSLVERGHYAARVVCLASEQRIILSVAGVRGTDSAEVEALARQLLADLVRP